MNQKVDEYIAASETWREELDALRAILLESGLTEEFKWRAPCYTCRGGNVVVIGALKNSCTLSFFKGALLKDSEGILSKPGENTRSARVLRFTAVGEIRRLAPVLKTFIQEAMELEEAGQKVDLSADDAPAIPEELQARFDEMPEFRVAFEALTPGRQRGYILHFSGARQSKTREARIEKCKDRIFDGKGLHDCTCGLSRSMPKCDGSHKFAN